jgi:uncharacterized membrane protein
MADNEDLKAIAIKILSKSNVPKQDNYGFAIITILMIISIVLTCIRVLQECNKSKFSAESTSQDKYDIYGEQLRTFSERRGWFTKMRIKKILRREMKKEDYEKYSLAILNALLETGEILTDGEIVTLVEAANV